LERNAADLRISHPVASQADGAATSMFPRNEPRFRLLIDSARELD
jgi:hypothetical protein